MNFMPYVTETENNITRTYDLISAVHKERIVFLNGQVDDDSAYILTMQLLHLESQNPEKDINLYINSPGGVVTAGMMIHDTMRKIKPTVNTLCMGQAASMGAFLLCAGTGKRLASPNARIMIHQPLGGYKGQASDIEIHAKEILRIRHDLNSLISKYSGQPIEVVETSTERDNFMGPEAAKSFGLIDEIVPIK